ETEPPPQVTFTQVYEIEPGDATARIHLIHGDTLITNGNGQDADVMLWDLKTGKKRATLGVPKPRGSDGPVEKDDPDFDPKSSRYPDPPQVIPENFAFRSDSRGVVVWGSGSAYRPRAFEFGTNPDEVLRPRWLWLARDGPWKEPPAVWAV